MLKYWPCSSVLLQKKCVTQYSCSSVALVIPFKSVTLRKSCASVIYLCLDYIEKYELNLLYSTLFKRITLKCFTINSSSGLTHFFWSNSFEPARKFTDLAHLAFVINTYLRVYRFVCFNKFQIINREIVGSLNLAVLPKDDLLEMLILEIKVVNAQ